jgi:FHS family Na+ dependent glucose MFS transporter 1
MSNAVRRSSAYFLLFFCMGMDMAVIGPTLPELAAQTGSTLAAIGMIFLLGAAGGTLGTLLASWLFGWAPGRIVLGGAQLCSGALLLLVPQVPWFGVLLGLFILKGVMGGMLNTGANTLLLWMHGEKAGPFVNTMHFFFGLGSSLSPFLLGLLLKAGGKYPDAYHLLGIVEMLAGVMALGFLKAPRPPSGAPQENDAGEAAGSTALVVLSASLFLFFYVGVERTIGGWIYTYAVTLHFEDAVRAAFLTSFFWMAFTVGRLISIPAAMRFSPRTILPVAIAGCGAFLGLLVLAPASPAALWVAVAGTGLSIAPIWPVGYTLAGQSVRLTARVSGLIQLGSGLGGMVLPGLMGVLMERAGAVAMPPVVLVSLMATFLAFLGVVRFGNKWRESSGFS